MTTTSVVEVVEDSADEETDPPIWTKQFAEVAEAGAAVIIAVIVIVLVVVV